jgi:hypothetical protein
LHLDLAERVEVYHFQKGYLLAVFGFDWDNRPAFFGGDTGSAYPKVVDIWESEKNSWNITSLSQPRSGVSVGEYALFGGGSPDTDIVDIFTFGNSSWTTTRLSEPKFWISNNSWEICCIWGWLDSWVNFQCCGYME